MQNIVETTIKTTELLIHSAFETFLSFYYFPNLINFLTTWQKSYFSAQFSFLLLA